MKFCSLLLVTAVVLVFFGTQFVQSKERYETNIGRNCTADSHRKFCGDELICVNNVCSWCAEAASCQAKHSTYTCKQVPVDDSMKGICQHKDLFPSVNTRDVGAAVAILIGGTLSGAGGIGGGGIFVPLLHLIGQFPPEMAVPLSKATILGASICNFLILMFEKHPHADRPLIDFDAALMLEPPTLLGTILGVYFNVIFPEWLIVGILLVVLGNATLDTFRKAVVAARKELPGRFGIPDNRHLDQRLLSNSNNNSDNEAPVTHAETPEETATPAATVLPVQHGDSSGDYNQIPTDEEDIAPLSGETHRSTVVDQPWYDKLVDKIFIPLEAAVFKCFRVKIRKLPQEVARRELNEILDNERKVPIVKLLILVACWIIVFVLSLLKGGHGAPSIANIKPCSPYYWIIAVVAFPIITFISVVIGIFLLKQTIQKKEVNYEYKPGDVEWHFKNVVLYPIICCIAGIFAALLGIGGGMIKGPVLLDLGLDPHVAAATSSLMILFTSSITSAQFMILGRLPLDYGICFIIIGFLSGLMGQIFIGHPARKLKLTFIIILSISLATAIATVLMGGLGIYNLVRDIMDGVYMGFNPLC